jgi:hypothetical protein
MVNMRQDVDDSVADAEQLSRFGHREGFNSKRRLA